MILRLLKSLFVPSQEEKDFLEALHRLFKEYDVRIGPRNISKTSKPEYAEKHREERMDAFPEISRQIKEKGFCDIGG